MKLVKLIVIGILLCSNSYAYGSGGCDKNAVFLNHFDGVDAATTSPEADCPGNGKHVLTFVGNAQLDTAQKVFGPSALLLDGGGDWVTVPSSTDFAIGTGDFTLDFRVRFNTLPSFTWFLSSNSGTNEFDFGMNTNNTVFRVLLDDTEFNFAWAPTTATWYHVAVARDGTNLRAFVDGTQIGTTQSSSNNIPAPASVLAIGVLSSTYVLDGWLDEFRITKGTAMWIANFTPPSTPYCSGCEAAGFAIND